MTLVTYEDYSLQEIVKVIQDDTNARIVVLSNNGKKYVWKKYTSEAQKSCELEAKNLEILSKSTVRICPVLAVFPEERSFFFELMEGDLSQPYLRDLEMTEKPDLLLEALTECVRIEVEGLRKLRHFNLLDCGRNGDYAYTYQRNLMVMNVVNDSQNSFLEEVAEKSNPSRIVLRYDPDIFNYLVSDNKVYSHDFSLWRTGHPAQYYAFFVADLWKMAEVDEKYTPPDKSQFAALAKRADVLFAEELERNKEFYFPNKEDPRSTYWLNKVEAYAYYMTWYLKRILAMDYSIQAPEELRKNFDWSKNKINELMFEVEK